MSGRAAAIQHLDKTLAAACILAGGRSIFREVHHHGGARRTEERYRAHHSNVALLKALGQKLDDGRWFTASAERNGEPILAILKRVLPPTGLVLEIGSGTGQHVAHFAKALPSLIWQPTDPDVAFRKSVELWIGREKVSNVRTPADLDVCRLPWPVSRADAVLCINMIHVAPWAATEALFVGANEVLTGGGVLVLYGPYRRFGRHTAPSNSAFDDQLQANDPAWGVRDLEAVVEVAQVAGFELGDVVDMPANNFLIVLQNRSAAQDVAL